MAIIPRYNQQGVLQGTTDTDNWDAAMWTKGTLAGFVRLAVRKNPGQILHNVYARESDIPESDLNRLTRRRRAAQARRDFFNSLGAK